MSTAHTRWGSTDWVKSAFKGTSLPLIAVTTLTLIIAVWTIAIFRFENVPFAILNSVAYGGIEAARSLALIFGATALFLFPPTGSGDRMRWVAFAMLILAIGGIVFNYVFSAYAGDYSANERLYASIVVRTVASGLMAIGLLPARAPRLTMPRFLAGLTSFVALVGMVLFVPGLQPPLADASLVELLGSGDQTHLTGLTVWHWVFSGIPLAVAVAIIAHLLRPSIRGTVPTWLIVALVLFCGSHLHNILWPSIYSPVATTADVLRIGLAVTVLFGAFLELRHVAAERAVRLAKEQEYARRLEELHSLRADFTRMIAHELSSPLAVIRRYADVLGSRQLGSDQHAQMVLGIQQEADVLRKLIDDVHTAAVVERDDFIVAPRPVPLRTIIDDAVNFAQTIPGMKIVVQDEQPVLVQADPERIAQVMRNLLTNAAKFSPTDTPVEILTTVVGGRVKISVKDQGPGIRPDDQQRIFEKFGRGHSLGHDAPPGLGLGLYVSRRIVHSHDSDLTVVSKEGQGAVFCFELHIVT